MKAEDAQHLVGERPHVEEQTEHKTTDLQVHSWQYKAEEHRQSCQGYYKSHTFIQSLQPEVCTPQAVLNN